MTGIIVSQEMKVEVRDIKEIIVTQEMKAETEDKIMIRETEVEVHHKDLEIEAEVEGDLEGMKIENIRKMTIQKEHI